MSGGADLAGARGYDLVLAKVRQELRAPVDAILDYAGMLLDDVAAPPFTGFAADLDRIRTAGERLLTLVEELLDPARVEEARTSDPAAFGARVRHDLRTPLNQIIGYAELLLEDAAEHSEGDRLAPDLQGLLAAARRLLARIDDLVRLSLAEEGATGDDRDDTLVHTIARDVASTIQSLGRGARPGTERVRGTILVVDDTAENREVLARRLERQGHTVAVAAGGREALARLASGGFDLVLLDMVMPEMDGYQVLVRLKEDPVLCHIPVILVTALGEVDSVVRCLELGAEDYVTKPFNPVILEARIGASLEKKLLRDREVLHLRQIEEEKRRADRLLRVILPDEIVEELQATEGVRPRRCPDVAVLFADVVGFTTFCGDHTPEEVGAVLQELILTFEAHAERHGLEKLKTIGDAFMAASGLLQPVENPVLQTVLCGLDMIESCRGHSAGWRVRVGIHCGEVMAGVVGRKKFLFDIWGDTVNTAARMESNGEPEAVCLSRDAWERVAHLCRGRSRGVLAIKGKGPMETFLVEGVAPRRCGDVCDDVRQEFQ